MKLLVHACCGPCSLEPHRLFIEAGHDVTLAYLNSNIHPQEEYVRRLETLRAWADSQGTSILLGEYDPVAWERLAGIHGSNRENRCRMCYRIRFEELASIAKDQGYDAISTTLSVSPYQFTQVIEEELQRAADSVGVEARFEDFRDRYPDATRHSREMGMYRQNYCGCHFSNEEAAQEREERKAARKAAKAATIEAREKAWKFCAETKKEMEQ